MKTLVGLILMLAVSLSTVGQGSLIFSHRVPGAGEVWTIDGHPLVGSNYLAQLWAGPSEANLRPIEFDMFGNTAIYPFPSPESPTPIHGYARTDNPTVVVENVAPGEVAWVQLRVWNSAGGAFPTWDHALLLGFEYGISQPVVPTTLVLGGLTGEGDPPLPPIPPPTLPPIPAFSVDPSVIIENIGDDLSSLISPQTLRTSWTGSSLELSWGLGSLESADSPLGPWVRQEDSTSPYAIDPTEEGRFYRVVVWE